MKYIAVCAQTKQQFDTFVREVSSLDTKRFIYVGRHPYEIDHLRGYEISDIIRLQGSSDRAYEYALTRVRQ